MTTFYVFKELQVRLSMLSIETWKLLLNKHLGMKTIMFEMKNKLYGINDSLSIAEEKINGWEDILNKMKKRVKNTKN